MPMFVRDAGVWKDSKPWVRDGGVWKPVQKGFVRDAGVWKEFYSTGAEPFLLSGSWETGWEGWTATGNTRRTNSSTLSRSGNFYVNAGTTNNSNGSLVYTIPKEDAAGLAVTASVWRRTNSTFGGSATALITIAELGGDEQSDGGSFSDTSYTIISASIVASGAGDVTITIQLLNNSTGGSAYVDDWEIEGVAP